MLFESLREQPCAGHLPCASSGSVTKQESQLADRMLLLHPRVPVGATAESQQALPVGASLERKAECSTCPRSRPGDSKGPSSSPELLHQAGLQGSKQVWVRKQIQERRGKNKTNASLLLLLSCSDPTASKAAGDPWGRP